MSGATLSCLESQTYWERSTAGILGISRFHWHEWPHLAILRPPSLLMSSPYDSPFGVHELTAESGPSWDPQPPGPSAGWKASLS